MDISPKTKEGIVDVNIHEESHVQEIYQELLQRFAKSDDPESLKSYLIDKIVILSKSGKLMFYQYNYATNTESEITTENAIKIIHSNDVWDPNNVSKLHVYYKNT